MAYGYGLVGVSFVSTSTAGQQIGATTANSLSGVNKIAIRVFDAMLALDTTANTLKLYSGSDTSGPAVISLDSKSFPIFNSNAGILFKDGCFAYAAGNTAHVSYIQEII